MSQPPLRLEQSFFSRILVESSPSPVDDAEPEVETSVRIARSPDDETIWMVNLQLGCDKEGDCLAPYRIDVQVHGIFTVDHPREDEAATAQMVGTNGASILYSAAREYLLLVTSRGPWGPFHLPTVSFFGERFRRQDEPDGEDEARGEKEAEEIVAALRDLGPLAAKPLAEHLGRSEGAVRRSLAALVEDGRVTSEKVGRSLLYGASEGRE